MTFPDTEPNLNSGKIEKRPSKSKKVDGRKKNGGPRPNAGRKPGKVSEAKRTLAQMAREHADVALATLAQICEGGETESARVAAANALLDRGYGKPVQALEHTGLDGGPIKFQTMSDAELDRLIAEELGAGQAAVH